MLICRVVGHVWATKKEEALSGQKLMVVREECTTEKNGSTFVAADSVGAGIVGIIDEIEVAQEQQAAGQVKGRR